MDQAKFPSVFSPPRPPGSGKSKSQALLEFALALPILLMLIFGIIDFALLFQAWLVVENISRQTVRYAVTGDYNDTYCAFAIVLGDPSSPYYDPSFDGTPDCAGDSYQAEQDYARLETIREVSKQWQVALFKNGSASESEKGYLQLTICSNRDHTDHDPNDANGSDFDYVRPVTNTTEYARCYLHGTTTPVENAGDPGDNVFVFVDFNHPLLTPFLSQVWPMVHLVSYRQGVVETFRTSRSIANPGSGLQPSNTPQPSFTPSNTPTMTFTPTDTPTPTNTPTFTPVPTNTPTMSATPTNTPLPLYLEIVNPSADGTVINGRNGTPFQAVTWDPNVGTTDGAGISYVDFWFSGPSPIPSRRESIHAYCAFGGDAPCALMPGPTYGSLAPGTYTMYVRSTAASGATATASITFIIPVPTPTNTPTITFTPSKTPTPSNTPTRTPTVPSNTPTRTFTPSNTPTRTPTVPSNTPTRTFTPSKTPTPTNTRTPTNTSPPPTSTPTRTNTPLPTATRTPTITFTPSKTPTPFVAPTDTKTPVPTRTPTNSGG